MASTKLLSPKAPDEQILITFNFDNALAATETVTSIIGVTCSVSKGFDPNPSGMISGIATLSGAQVQQLVIGGILNNEYLIKCSVSTSLNQKLDIIGMLTINE